MIENIDLDDISENKKFESIDSIVRNRSKYYSAEVRRQYRENKKIIGVVPKILQSAEVTKAKAKKYREKNREKINTRSREYYARNRDRELERKSIYDKRIDVKARNQLRNREFYIKNRDEILRKSKEKYIPKIMVKLLKMIEND